ncbi:colicin uptake protein TolQ [Phycisphaerae bacterium RAS1]|nr:colicin uptake protein TolQ [Phycisphaerae bacterium RAS1]
MPVLVQSAWLILAQTAPVAAAPEAAFKLESVWDYAVRGGPTMAVIAACSLVALTVIVERFIILRRGRVIPAAFLPGLGAAGRDRKRALDYCRAANSPVGRVLAAAAGRIDEGREATEKAVDDAGRRELVRLRQRMRLLGALPQVSTMLGLLGTIFGMIKTFQAVATSGQSLGKTEMLARGIFEAWTCTAAGLLVAIPVLIFYHVLHGRIDARMVDLDQAATDWVEEALHAGKTDQRPVAQGSGWHGQAAAVEAPLESAALSGATG